MTSENVELYLRALDAFNRGDKKEWVEICDPEVENHPPREWPESRPTKGVEVVWDFLVEGTDTWDEFRFEAVGPIEEGDDTLVVHVEGEMVGQASGALVPWSYYQVVRFRGEKAARFDWFADRAEALKAAGLSEAVGDESG